MGRSQNEEKLAVEAGYWPLYRFDPRLKEEGKNPSPWIPRATGNFKEFLMGEVRYSSLTRTFPEAAEKLFEKAEKDMKDRFETYKKLAAG